MATAVVGEDPDLGRRVRLHRERRPASWGTIEVGGGGLNAVLEAAEGWEAVLLDSLTLWVSARTFGGGGEEGMLGELDGFLERSRALTTPVVVVSDEVGLGVVPESEEGRRFRDALGLANARVAASAGEVHLCVAGIGVRIK